MPDRKRRMARGGAEREREREREGGGDVCQGEREIEREGSVCQGVREIERCMERHRRRKYLKEKAWILHNYKKKPHKIYVYHMYIEYNAVIGNPNGPDRALPFIICSLLTVWSTNSLSPFYINNIRIATNLLNKQKINQKEPTQLNHPPTPTPNGKEKERGERPTDDFPPFCRYL